MKLNLNQTCKVVLTRSGAEQYNNYINSFNYPAEYARPKKRPGEELKTQLWDLFHIFGNHIGLGLSVPFEDNVIELGELI